MTSSGVVAEDPVTETIKENASVVDSSLTECKHDLGNFDGPESSINKGNEDCNADTEELIYPSCDVGSSHMINDKMNTRYFVIKSLSHNNIQLSVEKGIWATQVMNEPVLDDAFHNSDRVILIFSVNMSGFFQGYAQMMSSVSWKRDNIWSKSSGGSNSWGRSFKVKWLRLCDLPFQKTLHIKNPLNDYKPVKISRDCQELSADTGEALCRLFDSEVDVNENLKRTNSFADDLSKRQCRSSTVHFGENNMYSEPSSHMRWAGSLLHPSLLYQHVQHQENIHHVMLGWSPKKSQTSKQAGRSKFQQSTRKDTREPISLTEEDFLSMTYEEYLQAVGGNHFSSHLPSTSAGSARDYPGFANK